MISRKLERQHKIKCCDVSLGFLRLCKMFPKEGKEDSLEFFLPIYGITAPLCLLFTFLVLYIIVGLNNQYGIEVLNFSIVCFTSLVGVYWINFFCIKNRHILISLTEAMSDFQVFGKPPEYDKFNMKMNLLSKLHLMYVTSGSLLYFIVFAPIHKSNCEILNTQKNLTTEICSLLVPAYVPFVDFEKIGKTPTIYIINVIQFLILTFSYTTCGTVVWMNLEMVEYLRLRIRHLKGMLMDAFKEMDTVARRTGFRRAVKYHNEILRMGHLADTFFGTELLLHVILTGAILGVSAFVILDSNCLEALMVFVGWLNAIIMGCVSGQRLINESSTIPDILYNVDWYNFEDDLKKDIVFFLLHSKKPMYIRAGNVIMTYQLIIEILRKAYSYVTFLSSINK